MINFIIYEDEVYFYKLYKTIIHKFMGTSDDSYKIYHFKEYSDKMMEFIKNLSGQNLYILDIEVKGKSGIDLAREIRKYKRTMDDQIIIATAHQDLVENAFHRKLLMVDFISKFDALEERLIGAFREIYISFNESKVLSYKKDGEIIRIPYKDILFIEKNKYEDCLYIETHDNRYKYKANIAKVEKILADDKRFFKTHRSCIVNVYEITKLNTSVPVIWFKDKYTNCLARDKKKELEGLCLIDWRDKREL